MHSASTMGGLRTYRSLVRAVKQGCGIARLEDGLRSLSDNNRQILFQHPTENMLHRISCTRGDRRQPDIPASKGNNSCTHQGMKELYRLS